MSYEDRFLAGLDRKRKSVEFLHPNIEKAHNRTEKIFSQEGIKMEAFIRNDDTRKGIYGEEEVVGDKQKASELKKRFRLEEDQKQGNLRMQAEVAEGLVYQGIGKYGWFGKDVEVMKTTDFDDYINGIDMMIEFGGDDQLPAHVTGLMIDITFSSDRNIGSLDKKFERISKEIHEGHLASVKYFQSKANPRFMGAYSDMPRVVVGMERSKVLELATLWVNEDRENELREHPVQRMFLEQIKVQLQAQKELAQSLGNSHLAEILQKELGIIQRIVENTHVQLGDMRFDQVHRDILNSAKKL